MSLISRLTTAFQAVGADVKAINLRLPLLEARAKTGATSTWQIPNVECVSVGIVAFTANKTRYEHFHLTNPVTVDAFGLEVTTQIAASQIRMALYNCDEDMQPTSLVVEAPTPADSTSTGTKTMTLTTPIVLPAGRYLKALSSGHAPSCRAARGGSRTAGFIAGLGTSPFAASFEVTRAHAAFPSTGVAWDTITGSPTPPVHIGFLRITDPSS